MHVGHACSTILAVGNPRSSWVLDTPGLRMAVWIWTRISRPSGEAAYRLTQDIERNVRFLVDIVSSPQAVVAARRPPTIA